MTAREKALGFLKEGALPHPGSGMWRNLGKMLMRHKGGLLGAGALAGGVGAGAYGLGHLGGRSREREARESAELNELLQVYPELMGTGMPTETPMRQYQQILESPTQGPASPPSRGMY